MHTNKLYANHIKNAQHIFKMQSAYNRANYIL